MDEELRRHLSATRSTVKAAMRALRTANQFLADLEERLDALEHSQPKGAQNGAGSYETSRAAARRD